MVTGNNLENISFTHYTSVGYYYQWIHDKSVEYAKSLVNNNSDQVINANSGTWTQDSAIIPTKPIPICTDITTLTHCDKKPYLCAWDSSLNNMKGACINNPKGR